MDATERRKRDRMLRWRNEMHGNLCKWAIAELDGWICCYERCRKKVDYDVVAGRHQGCIHHRNNIGADSYDNTRIAHRVCNSHMGSRGGRYAGKRAKESANTERRRGEAESKRLHDIAIAVRSRIGVKDCWLQCRPQDGCWILALATEEDDKSVWHAPEFPEWHRGYRTGMAAMLLGIKRRQFYHLIDRGIAKPTWNTGGGKLGMGTSFFSKDEVRRLRQMILTGELRIRGAQPPDLAPDW